MIENPKKQLAEIIRQSYLRGITDFVDAMSEMLSQPEVEAVTFTAAQVVELLNVSKQGCLAKTELGERQPESG